MSGRAGSRLTVKVAIAAFMNTKQLCRNGCLSGKLGMGTESAVARYVSEFLRGERELARKPYDILIAEVLD